MTTSIIHCYQNIKHQANFFGPKNKTTISISNYQHPTLILTQLQLNIDSYLMPSFINFHIWIPLGNKHKCSFFLYIYVYIVYLDIDLQIP